MAVENGPAWNGLADDGPAWSGLAVHDDRYDNPAWLNVESGSGSSGSGSSGSGKGGGSAKNGDGKRVEQEQRVRAEAEQHARAEAEQRARADAERQARVRAENDQRARAEAEQRLRVRIEQRQRDAAADQRQREEVRVRIEQRVRDGEQRIREERRVRVEARDRAEDVTHGAATANDAAANANATAVTATNATAVTATTTAATTHGGAATTANPTANATVTNHDAGTAAGPGANTAGMDGADQPGAMMFMSFNPGAPGSSPAAVVASVQPGQLDDARARQIAEQFGAGLSPAAVQALSGPELVRLAEARGLDLTPVAAIVADPAAAEPEAEAVLGVQARPEIGATAPTDAPQPGVIAAGLATLGVMGITLRRWVHL
ncbi:MAG TPA: hypothetical protein VG370_13200 [Chloroflexota bacterium]|nr:hypothetical protein [Chloroflexota bacterium]